MAIGIARMLGFRLRENFDMPYIACSITEFWRRWHISLTTWIREYLYIPLGGNRVPPARVYINLWICFLPPACGMVRLGHTSPGGHITACSWCWTGCFFSASWTACRGVPQI